jgi:hypothetical protein
MTERKQVCKVPADTVHCSESHLGMNERGSTLEQVVLHAASNPHPEDSQHPREFAECGGVFIIEYAGRCGVQVAIPDATWAWIRLQDFLLPQETDSTLADRGIAFRQAVCAYKPLSFTSTS